MVLEIQTGPRDEFDGIVGGGQHKIVVQAGFFTQDVASTYIVSVHCTDASVPASPKWAPPRGQRSCSSSERVVCHHGVRRFSDAKPARVVVWEVIFRNVACPLTRVMCS